jgi:hypothetical protein
MTEPSVCPVCKNLYVAMPSQPSRTRICSLCGGKIKKRHKYQIGSDGRLQHRDCKNPTGQPEINKPKEMFEE